MHQYLKYVYAFYALLTICFSAALTPGFQAPDERNHFLRAEQVSRGLLIPRFILQQVSTAHHTSPDHRIIYPDSGGYEGNKAIVLAALPLQDIRFHPENKITDSLILASRKIKWKGERAVIDFDNTAIYPPTGYLFSGVGICIGKVTHMPVLDTLILSRILNGLCCAAICFFAIALAGRFKWLMFFLLLLPLPIFLFASVSQDGLLISLAALFFAIIDHVESRENKTYSRTQMGMLLICITVISMARPPYFLLIGIFLFLRGTPQMKFVRIALPFGILCIWGLLNRQNYSVVFAPAEMHVNARMQLAYVLADPFKFLGMFFPVNTNLLMSKSNEYIGVLGWLDLFLPDLYYKITIFVFLLIFFSSIYFSRQQWKLRLACILFAILSFLAVMAAQYITWMPLESPILGGIQSRYFIPVILCVALGFSGFRIETAIFTIRLPLYFLLILFPLISLFVMVHQFIIRYYLPLS